jgi:hypothetical protein
MVTQIISMYWMRAIDGSMYIAKTFVMLYNMIKTIQPGSPVEDDLAKVPALKRVGKKRMALGYRKKTCSIDSLSYNCYFNWWDCSGYSNFINRLK